MRKIRIIFCLDCLKEDQDGVSNTCHRILERIPANFDPIVITTMPPERTVFKFPVHICPSIPFPLHTQYRLATPQFSKTVSKLFNAFQPDIIHWSSPSSLGKMAARYGHKYRIPVSAIYHTHFSAHVDLLYLRKVPCASHISRFFLQLLLKPYKNSDRVFIPSSSIKQFLIRKGLEVNKLIPWHRGVDSSRFHPAKRNASFAQKYKLAHTKTILFVSRLVRIKETDTLIRFYKLIENQFNLVVVGDGPDRKRMEAKMPEATFTGHLHDEELAQVYASCNLFIFPSTTETFGNVVLEAMASGLPVVAADEGGPRDIVQNGQTGYLVAPNNERAFFEKVLDILSDPSLAETLGQNARAYARKQNWDVICKQFFDYLQSLVSAKALGSSLFSVEE